MSSVFKYQKGADGIVTVTMDMTGPVNAMNAEYRAAMAETVARLAKEEGLRGVILTSGKSTFFAGGDLHEILAMQPGQEATLHANVEQMKGQLRNLERLPVPVVAAINGAALGGGFEIALACNRRIVLDAPAAVVGLPEVGLGLLPGAGGIVRTVHLLGLERALPVLLEGKKLRPQAALKAGLVDALAQSHEELLDAARAWILANPEAGQQPWDCKGYRMPGGRMPAPALAQLALQSAVMLAKKTRGLLPAPERILDVAVEAATIDFEAALKVETRGLVELAMSPQAKNIISTMFFQMNEVNGGAGRPAGIERARVGKLGVLGAGMMGQGIAYAAAMAGIQVILRDVSAEAAERGKHYSERLLQEAVSRGRIDEARKQAVLDLIVPTAELAPLQGCDLIVEAVYESVELKAQVTREAQGFLKDGGVFASNTSTLPISLLAEAASRPEDFIGIHFFSPVEKMPLIEIICGEKTGAQALARAFDFARQIGKTPIVVNDSLSFFTSRVFSTYLDEGMRLLQEGVSPVVIENLARQVGMPVGPMAVLDEVSLELLKKVNDTQRAMGVLHSKADNRATEAVTELMIDTCKRGGRQYGGGFYEYADDGSKRLWSGLSELFKPAASPPAAEDIKDRLLFRQVLESVLCLQEGVLRSVAEANVGSVLGIGAPVWSGGFLQFVNTYGLARFRERADALAARYGERFRVPDLLIGKIEAGETFR